jgi:hypothetical protein
MPFPNEETTPPVTQINRVINGTVAVKFWIEIDMRKGCAENYAIALRDGRSVYRKAARD